MFREFLTKLNIHREATPVAEILQSVQLPEDDKDKIENLVKEEIRVENELEQRKKEIETEIISIQRSTRVSIPIFARLHNALRSKYTWYYRWHTNPFSNLVHIVALSGYTVWIAIFVSTFIFSAVAPTTLFAYSHQTWDSATAWKPWKMTDLTVADTGQVSLNKADETTYKTSGEATITFDPFGDEVVDWLSYSEKSTLGAQTIKTEFSTDNILWSDDLGAVADSKALYIKLSFSTIDPTITPLLDSLTVNFSRYPNAPDNLAFKVDQTILGTSQTLTAGAYSDPDSDAHQASQWQITDKSGDYAGALLDTGAVSGKDELTSYKLAKNLDAGSYYFRVRYQDGVGAWSLWSNECAFTISEANRGNAIVQKIAGPEIEVDSLGDQQIPENKNEILDKRTATTKTIDNKNGTFNLEAFSGLAHYKENYTDPNAKWLEINPKHFIDNPEYVLFDQMPSTVKVFKDKIGYEIESRETGAKYTVELQSVDGTPKLSRSAGSDGLVAWADINPTSSGNSKSETLNSKLAEWLLPSALADATAQTDNGNLKFEFEIGENGVRLWKTIEGTDAPKNFTWNITKSGTGDDLKFRDVPDAYAITNSTTDQIDTTKPITIDARKTAGDMNSSFTWQETAPKTDLKIDTDVSFNSPDTSASLGYATSVVCNHDGSAVPPFGDVHDGSGTAGANNGIFFQVQGLYGPIYNSSPNDCGVILRAVAVFNTSSLGAVTITSTSLNLTGNSNGLIIFNLTGNEAANVYSANPTSPLAIQGSDFTKFGTTPLSTDISHANYITNATNTFALNAGGLAEINKTGLTSLGLREVYYDVGNVEPPTWGTEYSASFASTAATLDVTYSESVISISGVCKQYDQATNCADGETVKVARNGDLQAQTTTTSGGTWTISGVTLNPSDVVTAFISGVNDNLEANGVTKYDGTGNITGMALYEEQLAIGSDDLQNLSNVNLSQYDNSVSANEDIFFDVSSNNLTVDATSQSAQEKLCILALNTLTPGGNIITHDMDINGTFIPESNTINVSGSWDATGGTVTSGTSTVNFNSTATGETVASNSQSFKNLIFNGSGGGWTLQDNLTAATLTVTNGNLIDNAKTVTVNGNISIANLTGLLTSTGTWVQGVSGNISNPFYDVNKFNSLQIANSVTSTLTDDVYAKAIILGTSSIMTGATHELRIMVAADNPITLGSGANITTQTVRIYLPNASVIQQGALTLGAQYFVVQPPEFAAAATLKMTGNWNIGELQVTGRDAVLEANATTFDTNGYNLTSTKLQLCDQYVNCRSKILMKTGTHSISGNMEVGTSAFDVHGYFDLGSANISVGGNLTLTNGTVTPGTSTVTMNTTTTGKTITSASQSFNNLTFNGVGGGWTLQDNSTINGNFTVTNGTINAGATTITVAGNWDSSGGTFTRGTSTVDLTGDGSFSGGSFYNLKMGHSSKTTAWTATSIWTPMYVYNLLTLYGGGNVTGTGRIYLMNSDTADRLTVAGAGTPTFTPYLIYYGSQTSNFTLAGQTLSGPVIYWGDFTLSSDLTASELQIGGDVSTNGHNLNIAGNLNIGTYFLSDTSTDCSLDLSSGSHTVGAVALQSGPGTKSINLNSATLAVSGDLNLTGITVTAGTSTVNLTGAGGSTQTISGSTTFNNLSATAATARTINFASGSTQTVTGTWTVTGVAGQLITLGRDGGTGTNQWSINPTAWSVDYVTVSNSVNLASSPIAPTHSTNGGNTTNWFATHTVTISSAGTGAGTFDQVSPVTVNDGDSLDITATAAVSSTFTSWTGCDSATSNVCRLTNITAAKTASATFTIKTFTATISTNGTGSGTLDQATRAVNYGSNLDITATAASGSALSGWAGCDTVTDNICYLSNITADRIVAATFTFISVAPIPTPAPTASYTVNASAGTGGTIIPAGGISVVAGADQSFTIMPNDGYKISDVLVDNVSQGAVASYTFVNVTSDHTIVASFEIIPAGSVVAISVPVVINNVKNAIASVNSTVSTITHIPEKAVPAATGAAAAAVVAAGLAVAPIANAVTIFSFSELLRSLFFSIFALGIRRKKKYWGRVIEEGTGLPIPQAKLSLVKVDPDKSVFDSDKPVAVAYSDVGGRFAFIAEPGQYKIKVEKDMYQISDIPGYFNSSTIIRVKSEKEGLILPTIVLTMNPDVAKKKFTFVKKTEMLEKVLFIVSIAFLVLGTVSITSALLKNPHYPPTIVIAVIYPLLWFVNIRSVLKASPFGNVLDVADRQGVSLALVRIMDEDGKHLVRTTVTNEKGKYQTLVDRGKYRVLVSKPGYLQREGESIDVKDNMQAVNKQIEIEKKD